MTKELLTTIKLILSFMPNVPPIVFTVLDAAEGVATPEEFYGKVNKILTLVPVQENR